MPPVLLIAVAIGALATAVIAVVRPDLPTRLPRLLVWVAAAAGAVTVGLADTAPTGSAALDAVIRVLFGLLVPLAASRAGTTAPAWTGVVATVTLLLADAPGEAATGLGTGAFLALAAAGTATPAAAALATAAAVGPLSHADWAAVTGDSAAAMATAVVPVLLVGLLRTPRPLRGRLALGLAAVLLVLAFGAAAGLLTALSARSDVDRAVQLASSGIDRLGDDDQRARSELRDAAGAFDTAHDTLTAWWARSALLVPGVAQQTRAVTTMASSGAELARTAADASEDADLDSVRPRDGVVDLVALESLRDPLDRSVRSLRRTGARLAEVDSAVLLFPLAERLDDLRARVEDALDSADLAQQAVDVAPQLLGADGLRRWFIVFQNPAESTGNGGFLGNWAELVTDGGRLELTRSGRNRELTEGGPDPDARTIEGEAEFVDTYGESAARYWGNINFVPDHPTVGRIITQLYPQSGGAELDGVLSMTPAAMAGFLALTGPIGVSGYPEPLSSDNVERILLHDQYLAFPGELAEDREEFLGEAVEVLFDELTAGDLPGPRTIAQELGPSVRSRDLQLWAADEREQALFRRLGAAGEATSRPGVDTYGVVTQNFNGNKIDWFLRRDVSYDVRWSPATGEVSSTVTARISNEAPASGLPPSVIGWGGDPGTGQRPVSDGENFMWVFLYAPDPIEQITVDGEPVEFGRSQQLGHHMAQFYLSVPAQSVREVVARARGVVKPSARHVVSVLRQPLPRPDEIEVRVAVEGDWCLGDVEAESIDDGGKAALSRQNASHPADLRVDVESCSNRGGLLDRLRGRA
jgi:hypothetical protein